MLLNNSVSSFPFLWLNSFNPVLLYVLVRKGPIHQ